MIRIIKSLTVVGYATVMLLVLTGGKSANEAGFYGGHEACGEFNANKMDAYAPPSHRFVKCHAKVNEKYPVAWDNWSRQNGGGLWNAICRNWISDGPRVAC